MAKVIAKEHRFTPISEGINDRHLAPLAPGIRLFDDYEEDEDEEEMEDEDASEIEQGALGESH